MNDVVKICKKHGKLTENHTYIKRRQLPRKNTYICKICHNTRVKKYLLKNKERIDKQRRNRWNPIKEKDRRLKRLYNISLNEYNQMLQAQNEKCAICKTHYSQLHKKLNVDHDHISGKIRSLLCSDCNLGIGHLKDSIPRLKAAILYLTKYKKLYERQTIEVIVSC